MENKKLLNFLLKDLSELDELFVEKADNDFDELEMEFLKTRLKGAKKIVQILIERENQTNEILTEELAEKAVEKESVTINIVEEVIQSEFVESVSHVKLSNSPEPISKAMEAEAVPGDILEDEIEEESVIEMVEQRIEEVSVEKPESQMSKEMEMEEEEPVELYSKRLGDSFLKEKSVNDLMSDDSGKLEHKLSNRPINSIQFSIGINDRFQYIRELFEGSADGFVQAVTDIDKMADLKEAVNYLQQNFKWKKNETSLKFVNLVKRRFPND